MTKIVKRVSALLVLLVVFVAFLFGESVSAKAEDTAIIKYDERSIYEDLADLELNADEYVLNSKGSPSAISFMEYCYSNNAFISQGYYGLYVYIYNPTGKAVSTGGNVVNMATAYSNGEVADYNNVPLTLLSKTENNLLLKFKVKDAYARFYALAKNYAASNTAQERRYDVAGVQLSFQSSIDDTGVAKTFYFSGFSAGCGANIASESTLKSRSEKLETIELDVHHTYYRTAISETTFTADQLNTVYFSIPKDKFEAYGEKLQKIKAEWYEYKTKEIFVTWYKSAYTDLKEYMGKDIGDDYVDSTLRWRVLWGEHVESITGGTVTGIVDSYTWDGTFNAMIDGNGGGQWALDEGLLGDTMRVGNYDWEATEYRLRACDWILQTEVSGEDAVSLDDFRISSDKVREYMREYTDMYGTTQGVVPGELHGYKDPTNSAAYAKGLFADSIDADRVQYLKDQSLGRGYVEQNIDADEEKKLLFEQDRSFWDKLFNRPTEIGTTSYNPIVQVTTDIINMSDENFGKTYLINSQDAPAVRQYCIDQLREGNCPVLFRFAQTDYYAAAARFDNEDIEGAVLPQNGYVAQETVFLDFDIIQLTFRDDNDNETIVGVVSDPIDIIPDLDPSPDLKPNVGDDGNWWDDLTEGVGNTARVIGILIGAVVLILLAALVVRLVKWILDIKRE